MSPYAVAKLAGEGYCRSFHDVYGLETVSLRYFNVFGPRQDPLSQYAAVIPNFITAFLAGQPPTIFGDGEQSRDFTYVENVVEGTSLALTAENVGGEVFNVACDRITLNDLVAELRAITGCELSPAYEGERLGDVKHSLADITRARSDLGYSPDVNFSDGLRRTFAHYVGGVPAGSPR